MARKEDELTLRAIILGTLIGIAMTAANTYLGLYAGMTVSASIPAAIVSMGILRGLFRRGTVIENNIVQTMASSGESVAAGIIFTIPALVIAGVWVEFDYWQVTLIGLLGGFLGILFMIPLRRALIVEDKELIYPEGVACAQVLEAGETGGKDLKHIFMSLAAGLLFKGGVGVIGLFKGTVEAAGRAAGTVFYFGSDISVALLSVGLIVKLEIATLVFLGGLIGWFVAIPVYHLGGAPETGSALDIAWTTWSTQVRYMGVGAMVVGGLWSMVSVRKGMVKGISEAIEGFKTKKAASKARTDQDLPGSTTFPILIVVSILTFILYKMVTGSWAIAITAGVVMILASFFFVAVSSYIVGLVGSSNNPVSGMTICSLLFASGVLILMGVTGTAGILGALGVAGVVCCAAATAGDTSQDLKTGYLVRATPWKQQLAQFIGIAIPAFIIAPILMLLHKGYGIGTGAEGALKAPQAALFASLTSAIFTGGNLAKSMMAIGAVIGVALICLDEYLKSIKSGFRTHVMPVAVGIYLPLSLSVPIFLGGLVPWFIEQAARTKSQAERGHHKAVLLGSGLIAGEAIAGILIAFPKTMGIALPIQVWPEGAMIGNLASIAGLLGVTWIVYSVSQNAAKSR